MLAAAADGEENFADLMLSGGSKFFCRYALPYWSFRPDDWWADLRSRRISFELHPFRTFFPMVRSLPAVIKRSIVAKVDKNIGRTRSWSCPSAQTL